MKRPLVKEKLGPLGIVGFCGLAFGAFVALLTLATGSHSQDLAPAGGIALMGGLLVGIEYAMRGDRIYIDVGAGELYGSDGTLRLDDLGAITLSEGSFTMLSVAAQPRYLYAASSKRRVLLRKAALEAAVLARRLRQILLAPEGEGAFRSLDVPAALRSAADGDETKLRAALAWLADDPVDEIRVRSSRELVALGRTRG